MVSNFNFSTKEIEKINIKYYDYDDVKNENPKKFLNLFSKIESNLLTIKTIGNIIL